MKYDDLTPAAQATAFRLARLHTLASLMPEDYWDVPTDCPIEVEKYLGTREIILTDPDYTLDLIDQLDFDENGVLLDDITR